MMYGYGPGSGMMGGGYGYVAGAFILVFWILVIVGIVLLIRWLVVQTGGHTTHAAPMTQQDRATEILRERYAKGEITQEEFDRMKKDLM